ncbi:MAG: hypothetical protein RLZ37_1468 [Actinomycetota bacterium]|jgi:hypothetical protein
MGNKRKRLSLTTAWVVATLATAVLTVGGTAQPAGAGQQYEIDVANKELLFLADENVDDNDDDLPFTYLDLLPELDGCLQAVVDVSNKTAVTVEDVDDEIKNGVTTPGIFLEIDASPKVEPVATTAEVRFGVVFQYDSDCNGPTGPVPARLLNLCIHTIDIDDYQFFGAVNPTSYRLTADTVLTASSSGGVAIARETEGVQSDDPTEQQYWAEFIFNSTNSVTFLAGIDVGGGDSASFDVRFGCASWTSPTVTRPAVEYSAPDIDLDHYLNRAAEAEESLPNTK